MVKNTKKLNKFLLYSFWFMFVVLITFNIIWFNQSQNLYLQIAELEAGNYTEIQQPYNLSYSYVEALLTHCDMEDLTDRMECIVKNNDAFKYKGRKDLEMVPIEDLVLEGGDCENWANFFEVIGTQYNYSFTPITIKVTDRAFHRFTIIYDDTGYCYIDMKNVNCVSYDLS